MTTLEAVMRPYPRTLGIRPCFLGGLGVATRLGHTANGTMYVSNGGEMLPQPFRYYRPRETWAFATAGAGLEVGRAFIQLRVAQPIASNGPASIPLNVGFRFRD